MSSTRKKLYLAGDSQADAPKNTALAFFNDNTVDFPVAFFDGSDLADVTQFASATLQIQDSIQPDATVRMTQTLSSFNSSLTVAEWNNRAAAHCTFSWNKNETSLAAGSYHLVLYILSTADPSERIVYKAGTIQVNEDGFVEGVPPSPTSSYYTTAQVDAALSLKANLASPAFTGTPTAPTADPGTDTTQLANTAFVQAALSALLDGAPAALDTLNELAAAIGDDPNYAATINAALALKSPLASPAFTGTPTAPTAAPGTDTTQLANTAFVQAALSALLDGAPAALDTLNELAAALGDDPNYAATITAALAAIRDGTDPALATNAAAWLTALGLSPTDTPSFADATADTHALNRQTGDARYSRQQAPELKTGAYAIVVADDGKPLRFSATSGAAWTIFDASTISAPWHVTIINESAVGITLTPASGTINDVAAKTIDAGQTVQIIKDGNNWRALTLYTADRADALDLTRAALRTRSPSTIHNGGSTSGIQSLDLLPDLSGLPLIASVLFEVPAAGTERGLFAFTGTSGTVGVVARGLGAFISAAGALVIRKYGATTSDYIQESWAAFAATYEGLTVRLIVDIDTSGDPAIYVNGTNVSSLFTSSTAGTPPTWQDDIAEGRFILGRFASGSDFSGRMWPTELFVGVGRLTDAEAQAVETRGWPAEVGAVFQRVTNGRFETDASGWTTFQATLTRNTTSPITGSADGRVNINSGQTFGTLTQAGVVNSVSSRQRQFAISFDYAIDAGVRINIVSAGVGGGATDILPTVLTGTGRFLVIATWENTGVNPTALAIRGDMITGTSSGTDGFNIDNISVIPVGNIFPLVPTQARWLENRSGNGVDALPDTGIAIQHADWPLTIRGKRSASGFLITDDMILPRGHRIKAIYAYSTAGGSLTVGDDSGGSAANIVASVSLSAATWTNLTLLKNISATRKIHMTPAAETTLVVEIAETPTLQ